MNNIPKAYFNWSGGKDSALALYKVLKNRALDVDLLLTSINASFQRVSMHGVRVELMEAQAKAIGIPFQKIELNDQPTMSEYNAQMQAVTLELTQKGYRNCLFGDIFLEDLRKYRQEQLALVGINAHFPLWKQDTKDLMREFLALGFKTVVVCVKSEVLDESFVGRTIDEKFLADLPSQVDPCGENGEFHTFVYDGPIFKNPVKFTLGEKVFKEYQSPKNANDSCTSDAPNPSMGFWYCDLIPA
ncbi:MAG: diphthine--ammonia ligase [Cytophagales bacterium]|nr:diphthine--ammonia ligase [Cytophagales bacterium]